MAKNANSVNIEKKAYHHGDLRAALIAEGLRLLGQSDADSLSLREVARGVGVSAPSVYRHFPDKEALMTALAREGLVQLAAEQKAAAMAAGDSALAFAATGRAYVRFALANPALFRLIFASPQLGLRHVEPGQQPEAMRFLIANAASLAGADVTSSSLGVEAARAWALVHGLAMLMLDGQIPVDDALIDTVIAPGTC